MARAVLDADQDRAACGVGKGYNGAKDARRGREVALELERLALGPLQQFVQVHGYEMYSEVSPPVALQSIASREGEPYSRFCTCSRNCSIATFISTEILVNSRVEALEPSVLD